MPAKTRFGESPLVGRKVPIRSAFGRTPDCDDIMHQEARLILRMATGGPDEHGGKGRHEWIGAIA
jgi:hypothetical protein